MQNSFSCFIASTGQNVGKTTTCLGLLSGLLKRFSKATFLKPIGQEHVKVDDDLLVDKDVVLFREVFQLDTPYDLMSPVLFSKGFTRDYLDGKIDQTLLESKVLDSYSKLCKSNPCVVVEGTGHVGVGTIANVNNAKVCSKLGTEMILVASGGLGSSFDALALNKAMCDEYNVTIKGVILNKVLDEKRDMNIDYMTKALERWNIPLLGCIPYDPFLSSPTFKDYARLLKAKIQTGAEHKYRHFKHTRLVATSLEVYRNLMHDEQLVITPASRDDIILATIAKHWDLQNNPRNNKFNSGVILTGSQPPKPSVIQELKKANIPMLYCAKNTFEVMKKITSHTAKIRKGDSEKVHEAIDLVEKHIDFDKLIAVCS